MKDLGAGLVSIFSVEDKRPAKERKVFLVNSSVQHWYNQYTGFIFFFSTGINIKEKELFAALSNF